MCFRNTLHLTYLMTALKMTNVVLGVLVLIPGVWSGPSGGWVDFTNLSPCGVKGSSVVLGCSYNCPLGHTATMTTWSKGRYVGYYWVETPLSDLPSYEGRVEYIDDNQRDCSLRISNLQDSDAGYYYFGFEELRYYYNYMQPYAWNSQLSLHVTELTSTVSPTTVRDGEKVTLTCTTNCNLPGNPIMVWFRDGQPIPYSEFQARRKDTGSYTCAVKGQETVRSDPVVLDIQYGPQNVTLSVSPPGEVVKGSSVTLTCSSDANPAVTEQSYSLVKKVGQKDSTVVLKKKVHTIPNIQPRDSGQYYCTATNGVFTAQSSVVQLNVKYPPVSVVVSVHPTGPVRDGSSVTLTCHSDGYPQYFTWYRDNRTRPISTGPQLVLEAVSPADSGQYTCQVENKHGSLRSSPVYLDVQYAPVNVRVEVSPSGSLAEGSRVTLTCSSDANPAVDCYTWYRRTGPASSSSLVGSGQMLSLASLDPSQTGHYLCQARNSLGENNSTLVVLEIEEDLEINHRLILRVLIGVKLLAVLILPFVMVWAWRQSDSVGIKKKNCNYDNITYRGRGRFSSSNQDTRFIGQEVSL